MGNRAIIEISTLDDFENRALETAWRADAGAMASEADYHLGFASAAQLFSELTPKRLQTLERLKLAGSQSIYALAKLLGRNYRNVHGDIQKLLEHGLVEKDAQGQVHVPWDAVELHLALGTQAA